MRKKTTREFIEEAKKVHGNRYDYSKTIYNGSKNKVIITCDKHGDFEQSPAKHLYGRGCLECGKIKNAKSNTFTQEQFIKKAIDVHGSRYDYSKAVYTGSKNKLIIICHEHGEFKQTAAYHIKRGYGCPSCSGNNRYGTKEFIEKATKVHGDKYDYSLVEYINNATKVKIICPIHGIFKQRPNLHLYKGQGCYICNMSSGEQIVKTFLDENNFIFVMQHRFKNCKNIYPLPFDFYIPSMNIAIEYDGEQHFVDKPHWGENILVETQYRDRIKNKYCKDNNIELIRIRFDENIRDILKERLLND